MGTWPKAYELVLFITVPIGIIVCLSLLLTGYGWESLLFLILIPAVPAMLALFYLDR